MISVIIGTIGLIISLFIAPAQIMKTLKTKSVEGISVATYYLLLVTCSCYLIRAIAIREPIFIISNFVGVTLTAYMLILIYKYR